MPVGDDDTLPEGLVEKLEELNLAKLAVSEAFLNQN